MRIRSEALTAFRQLYLAQYGLELSEAEAREKAVSLLRLVELTYKPITKQNFEGIKARQAENRATTS